MQAKAFIYTLERATKEVFGTRRCEQTLFQRLRALEAPSHKTQPDEEHTLAERNSPDK